MGRDAGVTTQGPTQLSKKPIWTELPDQVPMNDADASTHPRAFLFSIFGDHTSVQAPGSLGGDNHGAEWQRVEGPAFTSL